MTEKVKGSDKPWLKNYKLGPYRLKESLQPYPEMPMYKFLDDSVAAYPGQVAVEYLGRKIKYSELGTYVDKLANALAGMGVKKGDKVLYGKYSGTEITLNDKEYLILRESDILAVL